MRMQRAGCGGARFVRPMSNSGRPQAEIMIMMNITLLSVKNLRTLVASELITEHRYLPRE